MPEAEVVLSQVGELFKLRQEIKSLTSQIIVLEQNLAQYQTDGALGFFHQLNRWVVNANEYIKKKAGDIPALVTTEGKDFDRVLALIKNTKESVETIKDLRSSLGFKDDVSAKAEKITGVPTTPESIANVSGDNRQQRV